MQASQGIEGVSGTWIFWRPTGKWARLRSGLVCTRCSRTGQQNLLSTLEVAGDAAQVLAAFIPQYYLGGARAVPAEIIVNAAPEDTTHWQQALSAHAQRQVKLRSRVRDARARWLKLAQQTAQTNLVSHLAGRQTILERLQALQDLLVLPELPERMECFDISHSSGEATVASCVVFDQNGARKSDYRKFNIEGITPVTTMRRCSRPWSAATNA